MPLATATSRRQHETLRRHADALLVLLAAGAPLDVTAVPDWPQSFETNMFLYPLSRMTGVLKVHVAMEIEGLYPRLLSHPDNEVRMLATNVIDKLKSTYDGMFEFRSRWPTAAVDADPETFIKQASFVVRAFHDSTRREETSSYNRVDEIFAAMEPQGPGV